MSFRACIAGGAPLPIVHRGLWTNAPENSLAALEAAITAGHRILEIDIRRTADGTLVLMHDDSLLRMTGIDQPVETVRDADLFRLRLHGTQPVPSLAEALDLCRGRAFLHLDAKDRSLLPRIILAARQAEMTDQVDVWGDLRSDAELEWFRKHVPAGMLCMARIWLDATDLSTQKRRLFDLCPDICEVRFSHPDQIAALAPEARDHGIVLMANTLHGIAPPDFDDHRALRDPESVWGSLMAAGVTLIQTDGACALQAFLHKDPS